ncbi:MAG: SPOR domain-containing protein, partial [Deltaproteobacteria bacterium]
EELPAKLEGFELRHLQQRISLRYHLRPLDKRETRMYLQHRLNMARAAGSTSFDKRAHREIYRFSKGVPRLINIIAERSLLAAYLGESRKIRQTHVIEGRQSLNGRFPRSRSSPLLRFSHNWKEVAVAFSVLVIASALVFVPAIREMLKTYVNRTVTQKSFAPLNYSRQFVRAEIPQPKPAVMKSPIRTEKRNLTSPSPLDKDPSLESLLGDANSKAHPVVEDGREEAKTAVLARSDIKPAKERFPQYLLKPPYVYTVQVESFQDPEIAATRMRQLQNRGFDAWVAWIDLGEMGTWYRVLVGKYKDKGEAQVMARKLSQKSEFPRARQIATHTESSKGQGANKD